MKRLNESLAIVREDELFLQQTKLTFNGMEGR